jgi:hypothetical protein
MSIRCELCKIPCQYKFGLDSAYFCGIRCFINSYTRSLSDDMGKFDRVVYELSEDVMYSIVSNKAELK